MPIQGGHLGAEFAIKAETVIKEKPIKLWQKVIDWHGLRRDQGKIIVRQTELLIIQSEAIDKQREAIALRDEMAAELKSLSDKMLNLKDRYIEILETKIAVFESGCQCKKEEK